MFKNNDKLKNTKGWHNKHVYFSMQNFLLLVIFPACMTPSELQQPAVLCWIHCTFNCHLCMTLSHWASSHAGWSWHLMAPHIRFEKETEREVRSEKELLKTFFLFSPWPPLLACPPPLLGMSCILNHRSSWGGFGGGGEVLLKIWLGFIFLKPAV